MKAARASKTAEQMALSRAIESRKPEGERVCFDPFAELFLGPAYRLLLIGRPLRDAVERLIERQFTGHHFYVIARTRCFDDFLAAQLQRRPEQLVILGAGYDSRAHRFADRLRGVKVFEVDHPATSAAKQKAIARMAGSADVTYVPVDFNVEKLAERLRACGYRDGCRTVFLWEGVTPYLIADAVDETLAFIRTSSGAGSAVMFDYVLQSFVDGSCGLPGAPNELARMQRTSEPLIFGIAEGEVGAFLATRGFGDVIDVGARELQARYFAGQDRSIKGWWRIVQATIA
jgi:methyltransferase (TIGR00027 family)